MAFDIDTRMDQWTKANRAEHSEDIEPILKSADKTDKKEAKPKEEAPKDKGETADENPVSEEEVASAPLTPEDIIAMILPEVAAQAAVVEGEPEAEGQAPAAPVDEPGEAAAAEIAAGE